MENRRPIKATTKDEILRIPEVLEEKEEYESSGSTEELPESSYDVSRGIIKEKKSRKVYYVITAIFTIYSVYMYYIHRKCAQLIISVEQERNNIAKRISELEVVLSSKYKEVDVADYLEGARILYDLTTPPYRRKGVFREVTGYNGELAIDKVCTKGHCYSFNGAEGKIAIAFKDEKIIKKIGISHPVFDKRHSAIKRFTVDCLVNNKEKRIGEFEYEIPGDSFQHFEIAPIACTGIIVRVKSNHGSKAYTCIYKIFAFE
ncbi:hypothetical protein NEFER03_1791 [Nematocida sp. LUAm3]|nr:hypothetical protein NEFER03_1791 [Nematocida sp. LUAm3]KAI5173902.1 hypothetical protein NEFER02_0369 [Nematocida sp. LUAm2]KAI5177353.1 hypothetical protein NEFER01_0628 [Nematocida sp. LUAm1]